MMRNRFRQVASFACLSLGVAILAGCQCSPEIPPVYCGDGTRELSIDGRRTCVVAPLSCGRGAQEQATGGQRECIPEDTSMVVYCAGETHQQEQATGGQRECVTTPTDCGPGEIEIVDSAGNSTCETAKITCGRGMLEQATGGQRECVPNLVVCGDNAQPEQATGGQRECRETG